MALQPSSPAASPDAPAAPAVVTPATAPIAAPNGAELVKPSRLPRAQQRGKWLWLLLAAAAVLLLGGPVAAYFVWFRGPAARTDVVTYHVEFKDLQLKIVERGSLEAGSTADVKCEVKTGSRGAAKIKWVVENGTYVNKGDLLVDIDDSYLQEQARSKKIDRDNAEALKIASEQTYPQKKSAISLAEQAQEKWIKGDYPQQLHDLDSKITIAKAVLQQQQDRTSWVGRMVKKGYMTASQEQAEEDNLNGDQLNMQNLSEQRKVLVDYTDPLNRKTNENAVKQAHVDERTAYADMLSKRAVFEEQEALYKDLMEQIALCKIYAPGSGIVVFYVPEQTRGGAGSNQSIIAQGEPVQYNQTLLRIPDLSHMTVNLRVHEAFINLMRPGLPCNVRVDAVGNKLLKGHVKNVAAAAAPQDWMSPDVKVYQAYVEIDDPVEQLRLKPGLSAVTTIYTESKAEHVLAVPVQTVLPPLDKGDKPHVFVSTTHGVEKRDVELGMTDEKFIEVKSGVGEGDEVVLDPRALLSDKEKKAAGKEDEKIVPTGGRSGTKGGGGRGRGGPGGDEMPGGPGGGGGPGAGRGGKPKQ